MNAYNPLATAQRLEAAGFTSKQAQLIATAIADLAGDRNNQLVTKDRLLAGFDRQTIRICIIMSAIIVLAFSMMGLVISTH